MNNRRIPLLKGMRLRQVFQIRFLIERIVLALIRKNQGIIPGSYIIQP